MILNYVWVSFFLGAFLVALCKVAFWGDWDVVNRIADALMRGIDSGVDISLGFIGVMTFWLGIMKIGENSGAVGGLARLISPFFSRLFPGVPRDHPANGAIIMNYAANMLGLDNAATPLGLKAMNSLQDLNDDKETASDAQIMFLVLNASGLTLIPVGVFALRAGAGATDITGVFIPILIATFVATLVGLIAVAIRQRLNLFQPVVLAYLGGACALVGGVAWFFVNQPPERVGPLSTGMANSLIFLIVVSFVAIAFLRRVNVYESFIDGAKGGFDVAIRIIPFLVAILCGVFVFDASGALDIIMGGLRWCCEVLGVESRWIEGVPTALMKPLSGSGARGMAAAAMETFGPDSFVGYLVSIMQGAADTTFFILAVYFGSVGIKRTRYALTCGLIAEAAGLIAAIFIAYAFYGDR